MVGDDSYEKLHERHMLLCDEWNLGVTYLEGAVKLLKRYLSEKRGDNIELDAKTFAFLERVEGWLEDKGDTEED